jgi:hypothetical protein
MANPMEELDPFYLAMLYFRINKVEEASVACTKILEKNPLDQVGKCGDKIIVVGSRPRGV